MRQFTVSIVVNVVDEGKLIAAGKEQYLAGGNTEAQWEEWCADYGAAECALRTIIDDSDMPPLDNGFEIIDSTVVEG